jgi:hypothetical protein
MTRRLRLTQATEVFAIIFILGVRPSLADSILVPHIGSVTLLKAVGAAFCITVVAEFMIIYLLLGRPAQSWKWLFLGALLVNAISFPPAQVGFFYTLKIFHSAIWLVIVFVIELLVVLLEWALLLRVFKAMYETGKLDRPVTAGRTLKIAFIANVGTCLLNLMVVALMMFYEAPHPGSYGGYQSF